MPGSSPGMTSVCDSKTQVLHLAAWFFARGLLFPSAPLTEGARECRVHGAPAVSCAVLPRKTHTSIQVHRNHPASPHATALRIITCSPRCTGSMATVADGCFTAGLASASRCRDHTLFPYASGSPRHKDTLDVHHSPPRVDDVAQRPSWWGGMEGNIGEIGCSVNTNFYSFERNIFACRS